MNTLDNFTRVPPQAIDLEQTILGSMIVESQILRDNIDTIKSEYFYKEQHREICTAIYNLYKKSEAIDILTVVSELKKMEKLEVCGGAYYVAQLTNGIASTANIDSHIKILIEQYTRRELIQLSGNTSADAYDESVDVFDSIRKLSAEVDEIGSVLVKRDMVSASEALSDTLLELQHRQNTGFSGVPSGFSGIDAMTGGWHETDLIILAARPGVGKSSFAMSMVYNIVREFNMPIGFFSLEMSTSQLMTKLIAYETQIPLERFVKLSLNDADWGVINSVADNIGDSGIHICDTPALSVFEIRAKARQLKDKYDIKMIVLDYLQLATAETGKRNSNREQEVSLISRTLKSIAKELKIPIMALAQLSRSVEKRGGDKKPMLSDLRESGAIEQDADIVSFLYRPDYYDSDDEITEEGYTEFLIEKNRHGATGMTKIHFTKEITRFVDPPEEYSFMPKDMVGKDVTNSNFYEPEPDINRPF